MKILIRRIHVHPQVARWREFESILKKCLLALNHDVFELDIDFFAPALPADPPEAEYRIYAHKTKRDVPGAHLFYKEMYMHHLFTVDTQGWGADHSRLKTPPDLSRTDADVAEAFCAALHAGFLSNGRSKHAQPPLAPVADGVKPYLLAPLQLPSDEVIRNHSPISVAGFINQIAEWAETHHHNVAIKLHPGRDLPELAELALRRTAASKHVFVLNENIHSLICESKGVIVINSGTGFESLIHGKPVITLGSADYGWFTYDARTAGLDGILNYIEGYSAAQRREAYRFVHFYYREHGYFISGDEVEAAGSRLYTYLEQTVGS